MIDVYINTMWCESETYYSVISAATEVHRQHLQGSTSTSTNHISVKYCTRSFNYYWLSCTVRYVRSPLRKQDVRMEWSSGSSVPIRVHAQMSTTITM